MVPFSNTLAPFVDKAGKILRPWIQYLQQFTIAPPNFISITVSASPFSYVAKEPGNVAITGGTISSVVLTRGANSISLGSGTNKFVPVGIFDTVTVTYSVLPTLEFIPSYGQNTNV